MSLGVARTEQGLQSERSGLQLTVLMLLDPLISKYETWRVKKKNQKRKGEKKVPISAMNNRWRLNSICIQYTLVPGLVLCNNGDPGDEEGSLLQRG